VLTQVWIALVMLLLLAFYKFKAKLGQSLTQGLKLLQLNLFNRSNLEQNGQVLEVELHLCQLSPRNTLFRILPTAFLGN
jgi:hypothetical protein